MHLKGNMLKSLENLFLQTAEDIKREDKDYGYRMAGDALLAFSDEGEAFLQECIDQDKNKRLAELAWRVLYYREKSGENSFNIITEKENDAAFSKRPVWLKTRRAPRLSQNFDRFPSSVSGLHGTAANIEGRWGAFDEKRVTIDSETFYTSPNSIKISMPGSRFVGWNANGTAGGTDYEISFMVYRSEEGAFDFRVKSKDSSEYVLTLSVDKEGILTMTNENGEKQTDATNLKITPGIWTRLSVSSDLSRNRCSISKETPGKNDIHTIKGPLFNDGPFYLVEFGTKSGSINIDDIEIAEKN
jgi:hypothetical protein